MSLMDFNLSKIKGQIEKYVKLYIATDKEKLSDKKEKYSKDDPSIAAIYNVLERIILGSYTNILVEDLIEYKPTGKDNTDGNDDYKKMLCMKPFTDGVKPVMMDYGTYTIGKTTLVTIESVNIFTNTENVRESIEQEFSLLKKAAELGVAPEVTDAYLCSNQLNEVFKVVYFKVPGPVVRLRKWLYEGSPIMNVSSMSQSTKAIYKKKYADLLTKLHDDGIIYSTNKYQNDDIFVTFKDESADTIRGGKKGTKSKKNKKNKEGTKSKDDTKDKDVKVIDKIFLTNFENSIDYESSKAKMFANELQYNPFERSYEQSDTIVNFVIEKLFDNKDVVIHDL